MGEWFALIHHDYLWRALLAGVGLSFIGCPLGGFIIWQRMAFFGDTLAHSGLLGVALAFAFEMDLMLGMGIVTGAIALLLFYLKNKLLFSHDALLGILSQAALAIGLICISLLRTVQIDVMGFLVGDILAITWLEVSVIFITAILGLGILRFIWSSLLRLTIDSDLALVEGVNIKAVQITFLLLLSMVVAVAVKLVGVLLVSAMLIIPSAAAGTFAKSPEKMAVVAAILGMCSTILGVLMAVFFDLPVGPSIVLALLGFFLCTVLKAKLTRL